MKPGDNLVYSTASRRETRREERRKAILDVAARSFLEKGYAGTTMSAIAATLGGSKGTLWSYFSSKEALFAAVIDDKTLAFRERLQQLLDSCGDLRATLERCCMGLLEKVVSDEAVALYRLVVAESVRFPEMGAVFFDRAPGQVHMLLGEFLGQAMDRGLLRRDDPIVAARALHISCLGGCHQRLLFGLIDHVTPDMIADDARRAVNLFLRAYQPAPPQP